MSEAEEDVKPKLNITVNYEGQSMSSRVPQSRSTGLINSFYLDVTVKVKSNTTFKKIFEAAEVRTKNLLERQLLLIGGAEKIW